jgi:hypothetical protein
MATDPFNARPPLTERRRAGHESRYSGPERRVNGRGHSGYGMDSIRCYLRVQLELHSLLRPGFPPPDDEPGALFTARLRTRTRQV